MIMSGAFKEDKAPGPSGLTIKHVRYLAANKPFFTDYLAKAFNDMLGSPN